MQMIVAKAELRVKNTQRKRIPLPSSILNASSSATIRALEIVSFGQEESPNVVLSLVARPLLRRRRRRPRHLRRHPLHPLLLPLPSLPLPLPPPPPPLLPLRQRLARPPRLRLHIHGLPPPLPTPLPPPPPPQTPSTLFAIPDPPTTPFSSLPLPRLLRYHTLPHKLPFHSLSSFPIRTCLPTLLPSPLVVTDAGKDFIFINGAPITHPDIFVEGPYAIHGIARPFCPFDPSVGDFRIPDPLCDAQSGLFVGTHISWDGVVRRLGSAGHVSFSVGLNSVVSRIVGGYPNLMAVTIFAPPDEGFDFVVAMSPVLDRVVGLHIVPRRADYGELASMPGGVGLPTLIPGRELKVSGGGGGDGGGGGGVARGVVEVEGVRITNPMRYRRRGWSCTASPELSGWVGFNDCVLGSLSLVYVNVNS
ncbi:hypothetical protein QJS10_CPB11g01118 [Acorus calamus]|uniref:FAS1 domain-containing protein n=1 Tax=Acorus calamus TaxID=4465 RepID=A0AAV9DUH2_ACOCL|nr:hypothetical protein QJS10_CPB11g01118 [Acorus calamus]